MKKLILFSVMLTLLFAVACTKKKDQPNDKQIPTVGIAKIVFHVSLNSVEEGIIDELVAQNINAKYDLQNANGDMNTAASIANKFKSDKVDVAVGIATPIAVALANTIQDRPVIFSAITDPISAHLVESLDKGYNNVTGAVDTIPIREQIIEFRKIVPFKKLGFIYTSSESNSVSMAATTKAVCDELGIEFIPATITNSSEIKQAAESIVGRVDAFYVITDNAIASGVNALTSTARANKIPVFSGDAQPVMDGGAILALGFDYYKLGRATGRLVADVLKGKKPADIPVFILTDPSDYITLIDLDTAKYIGVTIPAELKAKASYIIENGKLNKIENK